MSEGQNLTNPSKLIVSPLKMVAFLLSTATSGRYSQTYCYSSYDAYCKRRLLKLRQNEECESFVQVAFCPLLLSYCVVQPNNITTQFCKSSVNRHFSLRRLTLGNYRHCPTPRPHHFTLQITLGYSVASGFTFIHESGATFVCF